MALSGVPAFHADISNENIANMPMHGLHALLQEKSLPDSLRDKMKGQLAVRRIEVKGKAAATTIYDILGSQTNASSLNLPIRTESHQKSELDNVSTPLAALKFSMMADRSKCAGTSANASRRSLNDHTKGTMVTMGKWSPESTVQHYPFAYPPLPASRNEQAHLQESNAKCRDNHNVGRAGTTVFSSEPTAHYQQSAVYALDGADIEAGRAGTTVFSSEPTAHYQQSLSYAPAVADIEAGAFTTCSEPPPETIAMFKEPPAVILIAGGIRSSFQETENLSGCCGEGSSWCYDGGFYLQFHVAVDGRP